MKLHCDHIHSMFDGDRKGIPTLSLLGCLNDDYEGGEICFPVQNRNIKMKKGDILAFPPYWTHPHYSNDLSSYYLIW